MRICLIRHGQSEANADTSAEIDCDLTAPGRRQSEELAAQLAQFHVGYLLTSPYRRCVATAEYIRSASGAPAELYPALHEHHGEGFAAGPWPLPAKSRLARWYPEYVIPDKMSETHWAAAPESDEQLWRRISGVVDDVLGRFGSQTLATVALVTHGGPLITFVLAFCQWENRLGVDISVDNGSITILELDPDGRRRLVTLNARPPLWY